LNEESNSLKNQDAYQSQSVINDHHSPNNAS